MTAAVITTATQKQAVGTRSADANCGITRASADRACTDRTEQNSVEACIPAQKLPRDERKKRPDRAGEGEEDRGPQKHDVKRLAGAGVAQSGAERAEEVLLTTRRRRSWPAATRRALR